MDIEDVKNFFNKAASNWDTPGERDNTPIIKKIVEYINIEEGMRVLDVACGTGVMFPFYLEKNVSEIYGIDISDEMLKIASGKFANDNIKLICSDVCEYDFDVAFDRIVIYNAFPHFIEPDRLINKLYSILKSGGRLTIAHGASREEIDSHHHTFAKDISNGLMDEHALSKLLINNGFEVDVAISDDEKYIVSGKKN